MHPLNKPRKTSITYNDFTTGHHSLPRKFSSNKQNNLSSKNQSTYYESSNHRIYFSKALVLISKLPLVYTSEILLQNIWKAIVSNENTISIEDVIRHLLTVFCLFDHLKMSLF